MKERVFFVAGYVGFWLSYFLFFKAVFLLYHQDFSRELDMLTLSGIFFYGSLPDLSAAIGLSLLPFTLLGLSLFLKPGPWLHRSLLLYTNSMLIFLTILCTTDLELYRIWGFRLDASPLMYLNTPSEMFISIGASPLKMLIILNILINLYFCFAYRFSLQPLARKINVFTTKRVPIYPLTTALLIIPMIGGIPFLPDIRKHAFFSAHYFANQATINAPLNFAHSLHQSFFEKHNPYAFLQEKAARRHLKHFYPEPTGERQVLIKKNRPNVVLIIWESFTSKAAAELGGQTGVSPEFSRLSREGMLFSRMYASGDRSDKGLVALLSAFPAQPGHSILKYPKKVTSLPQLSQVFKKAGYRTGFYYGGNLDFANFRHYLEAGSYDKLISRKDFSEDKKNASWGAHDHVVFDKLLKNMSQEQQPFFKTIFTLSSHEPFDIPAKPAFKGKHVSNRLLSALHYTDSTIGHFIRQAKKLPCYENTLFIIVADHGHTYPGKTKVFEEEKFHIPMLWFGGALQQKPGMIKHTMSQTDLAASLLGQLNLSSEEFRWSKDIFQQNSPAYAHYFFKDGVGFITDSSFVVFDNISRKTIEQQGAVGSSHLKLARTYLQLTYGDYLNK